MLLQHQVAGCLKPLHCAAPSVTPPGATLLQLVHERLRDQQLDLELARRQQEVRGRLEYINTMGEAQASAEQAERSRLQRKRQQLEAAHKAELQQVGPGRACMQCNTGGDSSMQRFMTRACLAAVTA
jgi:hypothetical protein